MELGNVREAYVFRDASKYESSFDSPKVRDTQRYSSEGIINRRSRFQTVHYVRLHYCVGMPFSVDCGCLKNLAIDLIWIPRLKHLNHLPYVLILFLQRLDSLHKIGYSHASVKADNLVEEGEDPITTYSIDLGVSKIHLDGKGNRATLKAERLYASEQCVNAP